MTSWERPVFVFGCPRSGTSLLSQILDGHPRIAVPYESQLYQRLYRWRWLFDGLERRERRRQLMSDILDLEYIRSWRPRPSLDRAVRAVTRPDFHGVFEGLLRSWAAQQGKPRWGEKTPRHTFYWRELHSAFPDMKVVHLVRDGRDVALSYRRALFGPDHLYALGRRWMSYLDAVDEMSGVLGPRSLHEVRYEDILKDPWSAARDLCDFLGETFAPEMLETHEAAGGYPTDERNRENLQKPIMASNRGKWRTRMSTRELRVFEAAASEGLERYGYEPVLAPEDAPPGEVLRSKLMTFSPRRISQYLRNVASWKMALGTARIVARWGVRKLL